MKPLKVAFLWHQHQPYYKWEDIFILPWVRMHGVKDYFDLPQLLKEFPNIKQTFNFAPSLMIQIDEYISGKVKDKVQILTEIPATSLSENEKSEILKQFFVCNLENLIKPNPRYLELYTKAERVNQDINAFTAQDYLDLQVWYNLAWIGEYSKQNPKIAPLFSKSHFEEEDKKIVLEYHIEILKNIALLMNELKDSGQIEISCSPEYHPILPILIDHASALEAMPWLDLSDLYFRYPEDAKTQIYKGIDVYQNTFGNSPEGIWPSEGSLSDATLDLLIDANIKWVATDEQMLKVSLQNDFFDTLKFFPQRYRNPETGQEIKMLFRDHFLSDRIGFVYSNWDAQTAADEFVSHLDSIRNEIIRVHGEDALDFAVVTVILDGENCWEFYKENGFPFLRALFGNISSNSKFATIKCKEASELYDDKFGRTLSHINSGSWINANFSIWIGHSHDIAAWKMLARARNEVDSRKHLLSEDKLKDVMNEIYIAEGSDWFWWYGPEHNAPNKPDFDVLFRNHIDKIYKLLAIDTPMDVFIPIGSNEEYVRFRGALGKISPKCSGSFDEADLWKDAAVFNTLGAMSTMHKIGEIINQMIFGNDSDYLYFRFSLSKMLSDGDEIYLTLNESFLLQITHLGCSVIKENDRIAIIKFTKNESIDIKINTALSRADLKVIIELKTISQGNTIIYNEDFPIHYYYL